MTVIALTPLWDSCPGDPVTTTTPPTPSASIPTGSGSPVGVIDPAAYVLYYDTTNKNLWASDGSEWNMMV